METILPLIFFFYSRLILASADLINVVPKAEVVRGRDIVFPCTTSFGSKYLVEWQRTKVGSTTPTDVFRSGALNKECRHKFKMSIDSDKGEYNLTIMNAELNDAGIYTCLDMDGAGEQRKTSLIVYDFGPVGESNVSLDKLVICDDRADYFELSCKITYKGYDSPELILIKLSSDGTETELPGVTNVTADMVILHVVMKADPELNGAYFRCQTKLQKYKWTSSEVLIQYALANETIVQLQKETEVTCKAHSNQPCRYKWISEDEKKVLTNSETLDLTQISVGLYVCEAVCTIGGRECTVKAMVVNYSETEISFSGLSLAIGLAALGTFIAISAGLVGLFIFCKRKRGESIDENAEKARLLKGNSEEKLRRASSVEQLIVRGISELDNRLYIIFQGTKFIRVIKGLDTFEMEPDIPMVGLDDPWGLGSCERQGILYISDRGKNNCIWRLNPKTSLAEKLITDLKEPHKFSVTPNGQIIIPRWPSQLEIIESGNLERRIIELPKSMLEPYDALLISPNSFIVAHGHQKSTQQSVCLVEQSGQGISTIQWSYPPNGSDKINNIDEMALDDENILYVTDQNNQRVIILSIEGQLLSHIDTDKLPYRLFYSRSHQKLLAGHHGALSIYEHTGEDVKMQLQKIFVCESNSFEWNYAGQANRTQTKWNDDTENPIKIGEFTVSGIAELNNRIYVVTQDQPDIRIFDCKKSFKEIQSIKTDNDPSGNTLSDPWFIDACSINKCLYITDRKRKCIIKVTDPEEKPTIEIFKTDLGNPFKLSVTSNGLIIVPVWPLSLDIYNTKGVLVDTVHLPDDMKEPCHAIEIERDNYVFGHGDKKSELHRVCKVKWSSKKKICEVKWKYGNERGNKEHQLNRPRNVVVGGRGHIFVTDEGNRRIVQLGKDGRLLSMKEELPKKPERMFYSPTVDEVLVGGYGFIDRYYINEQNQLKFCPCSLSNIHPV